MQSRAKQLISLALAVSIGIGIGGYSNIASASNNTLQSKGTLTYTNPSTGQMEIVIDPSDHEKLQENIDANTSAIHDSQSAIADNTTAINQNKTDINNLQQNIENLHDNSSAIQSNTEAINQNKTDIAKNTEAIVSNSTLISRNTADIEEINETISSLSGIDVSGITVNAANITKNTTAIANNVIKINTNTANISANASAIEGNSSSIKDNTTAIANNKSLIDANTGKITSLEEFKNQQAAKDSAQNSSITTLQNDTSTLKTDVNTVKSDINTIKTTYNTLTNNYNTLNSNYTTLSASVASLEDILTVSASRNDIINMPVKTNLRQIYLYDENHTINQTHRVQTDDASTLTNSPITSGKFLAKWECLFLNPAATGTSKGAQIMVKITEMYPVQGRVWYSLYTDNWSAWSTPTTSLETKLNTLQSTVNTNKSDISTLKTNVNTLDTEVDKLLASHNLSNAPLKTALTLVDLTNPNSDRNQVHLISTSDASTLSGSPITTGTFAGKWECIWLAQSRLMVEITEFYPMPGRVWYNSYNNNDWTGWYSDTSVANDDLTKTTLKTNLLDVDLANPAAAKNRKVRFGDNDASKLTNSPITSGAFFGSWEVEHHTVSGDKYRALVKVTEYYPVAGRVWYNHFNWTQWAGWTNNYDRVTNVNTNMNKIRTYVGSDGKLHFVDATGKDTTLNFRSGSDQVFDFIANVGYGRTDVITGLQDVYVVKLNSSFNLTYNIAKRYRFGYGAQMSSGYAAQQGYWSNGIKWVPGYKFDQCVEYVSHANVANAYSTTFTFNATKRGITIINIPVLYEDEYQAGTEYWYMRYVVVVVV